MTSAPLLWLAASAMAVLTAWLVKKGSEAKTLNDANILLFLLVMMVSMFASAVDYLYSPGYLTIVILLIANMVTMSVVLVPIAAVMLFGDRELEDIRKGKAPSARFMVEVAVIALVILSELFMGWTFAIIGGSVAASGGVGALYSAVVASASSYWFLFTMAGEMAITVFLLRKKIPRSIWWIVGAQSAMMFLSPTAIVSPAWAEYSTFAGSAVMVVLFVYVFEFLYRNRTPDPGTKNYLVRIMSALALMMAGVFVWLLDGDATVFVLSVVFEMVVYFWLAVGRSQAESASEDWRSSPFWVFGMLGLLFVAEFFMGGAIDIYAYGTGYFTGLPLAAVGASLAGLGAVFYDFIVLFSSVTASAWYLIMMGVEMGALVLFKIGHAREFETKVRLGMVIAAYGAYAIFLPYFVFPSSAQYVPWIGWSMGLGTAGALAPDILVALLATYFISGALSFLFGSRNVCSLFCTAALMYQGTAIDSMSSFNRTSTVGRKFLTSRLNSIYKVSVSVVWLSLIASAAISYLNSVGVLDITFFGTDASYFVYSFYFSFLWYVVWMMIPFIGTYGCVNTGMCGWGSFNQLISRLGFFRLKVMDSDVCVRCETKDCAKVCPVGITDQPGSFIASGELRSMKCIGVGDCVSACPYENIYFYDVRGWIRKRLHLKGTQPPMPGAHLPVRLMQGEPSPRD